MTRSEQRELIESLKDLSRFLKGKDLFDFEMALKRHRDDEELDSVTLGHLQVLLKQCQQLKPKSHVKNPFEP